ncbi:MAG TPA: response regulator transcription factor [Terriglobales bacterium]|jgi:DNA-binding NarL/FixJ family response regulator|nr:response regulator transcription factor [Terriglobales bacterium]
MATRILVADDSPFWREEMRTFLERNSSWTVFEASDGSEAVRKSGWIHPDVVILDMCMPILDGLGAARELRRRSPDVPVLILTVDKTPFLDQAAHQAGVRAVFSKTECLEVRKFLEQTLQGHDA